MTMVLRAVLGTEVSMVWEAVRSVSFFRSGVRLSNGKRRTRGLRLKMVTPTVSKLYDKNDRSMEIYTDHFNAWFWTSPC